jgi:hypothetical protein
MCIERMSNHVRVSSVHAQLVFIYAQEKLVSLPSPINGLVLEMIYVIHYISIRVPIAIHAVRAGSSVVRGAEPKT